MERVTKAELALQERRGPNNSALIGGSVAEYSNHHSKAQENHTLGTAEGLNPEQLTN